MPAELWQQMVRQWPLVGPAEQLERVLGEACVALLARHRVWQREPYRPGMRLPCSSCSQLREVIRCDGLWAICPDEGCEDLPMDEAARAWVDGDGIVALLRRQLRLTGPHEALRWNRLAILGERQLGQRRALFALAPRPRCIPEAQLSDWLAHHGGDITVLLSPTEDHRLTLPRHASVASVSLERLLAMHTGTVDLCDIAEQVDLPGADPGELYGTRYDLFRDQYGCFYWAGQPLELERKPRVAQLLTALAERPGRWIPRNELILAVYPDEVTNRGNWLTDAVKLERRLRQVVSELNKAFRDVGCERLAESPVENLRAGGGQDGGYRLALEPSRVSTTNNTFGSSGAISNRLRQI